MKTEDSGVYECVVQNPLGRSSVLYRLKVLPSFTSTKSSKTSGDDLQSTGISSKTKETNLNTKVNNTSIRSRKSVLDSSYHQTENNLVNWPTKLMENSDDDNKKIEKTNLNKQLDNTMLSLHNVTIQHLGEKATLRCVVDGKNILVHPHFRVRLFFCIK